MHFAIEALIKEVFQGQSHQRPVVIGRKLGWKDQTSYGHVSDGTFPVNLTPICGKKLVSLPDYIKWLEAGSPLPATYPEQPAQQPKKKRGRPSHKEIAARAKKGGAA